MSITRGKFRDFVNAACEEWADYMQIEADRVSYAPNPASIRTAKDTTEIGTEGELHIQTQLTTKGFISVLSERSRSPSDVWGIMEPIEPYDFLHIVLIQVKTAEKQAEPKILTEDEAADISDFPQFILQSKAIAQYFNNVNVTIMASSGYARVKIVKNSAFTIDSGWLNFVLNAEITKNTGKDVAVLLDDIYQFD
jgi:hypothetical protein